MDTRILILPLIALLAACATAPEPTPASSYTVQEESDGSLRIVVTAASQRLATMNHVSLPLCRTGARAYFENDCPQP